MKTAFLSIIALMCTVCAMAWQTSKDIISTGDVPVSSIGITSQTATDNTRISIVSANYKHGSVDFRVESPAGVYLANDMQIYQELGAQLKIGGFVAGTIRYTIGADYKYEEFSPVITTTAPAGQYAYIKKVVVNYQTPDGIRCEIGAEDAAASCEVKKTTGSPICKYTATIEPDQPSTSITLCAGFDANNCATTANSLVAGMKGVGKYNYMGNVAEGTIALITNITIDYVLTDDNLLAQYYKAKLIDTKATMGSCINTLAAMLKNNSAVGEPNYAKTVNKADVNGDGSLNATDVVTVYNTIINGVATGTFLSHEYVDLGLPSGKLWATCDLGAEAPEAYGDLFSWGEKDATNSLFNGKQDFSEANYTPQAISGTELPLQYSPLGPGGAYYSTWGYAGTKGWQVASKADYDELRQNTTVAADTQNGVAGYRFTASNGKSLFFPATPYHDGYSFKNDGIVARWTSTTSSESTAIIMKDGRAMWTGQRYNGYPIRCVVNKSDAK